MAMTTTTLNETEVRTILRALNTEERRALDKRRKLRPSVRAIEVMHVRTVRDKMQIALAETTQGQK